MTGISAIVIYSTVLRENHTNQKALCSRKKAIDLITLFFLGLLFSSCGQMNTQFYDPNDPFCKNGAVNFRSGLDLFYKRLLLVEKGMHTKFAKQIAKRRTIFLKKFLDELELEFKESKVI